MKIEWMNQRRTTRSSFVSFYALSHSQSIINNDWLRFVCHGDCWLTTVKHESAFSVMHALLCTPRLATREGCEVCLCHGCDVVKCVCTNVSVCCRHPIIIWMHCETCVCLRLFVPWHPSIIFVIDVLITVSFSLIKSILTVAEQINSKFKNFIVQQLQDVH